MKRLIIISLLILTGCFDDITEIKSEIARIQANTSAYIEPMPDVIVFTSFKYSAEAQRSPFVAPKPEAIQGKTQPMSGCLSPDPDRHKQPLENFALGDLVMRGTLGDEHSLSALLEASDANFYRVSVGNYVGLFNGRIIQVGSKWLKIVELTPDGAGCWVERETVMNLATSNQQR